MKLDLDQYNWGVTRHRTTAHALIDSGPLASCRMCGGGDYFNHDSFTAAPKDARRCQGCVAAIVKKEFGNNRRCWHEFLADNPEYAPPSWHESRLVSAESLEIALSQGDI